MHGWNFFGEENNIWHMHIWSTFLQILFYRTNAMWAILFLTWWLILFILFHYIGFESMDCNIIILNIFFDFQRKASCLQNFIRSATDMDWELLIRMYHIFHRHSMEKSGRSSIVRRWHLLEMLEFKEKLLLLLISKTWAWWMRINIAALFYFILMVQMQVIR